MAASPFPVSTTTSRRFRPTNGKNSSACRPTTAELQKLIGVKKLFGERGFTPIEQRSARPTFEINGLTSGYQGEGSKTIVPAWARAKITCRLVPNQRPARIRKIVCDHLRKICPPTVRLEIEAGHGAEAYLVSPDSPQAQAALRALREAFQPRAGLAARGRLHSRL